MLGETNLVAPRGGLGVSCALSAMLLSCPLILALAAEAPPVEAVKRDVESLVKTGRSDYAVVQAIRKLDREERARLAARLIDSPEPAMRYHAMLILKELPPKDAAQGVRKLLKDPNAEARIEALLYLAEKTSDRESRTRILRAATDADPDIAAAAIRAVSRLGGPEVAALLAKILADGKTPMAARLAAIQAAAAARATECTPALVRLLDRQEARGLHKDDTVRVCDMAAAALEAIYRINYIGASGSYYTAPLPKRDEGIALWRVWALEQAERPASRPREVYVGGLLEESLKALAASALPRDRGDVKTRLRAALGGTFCLGDLPGVDMVVAPAVRDAWRMMLVTGEDEWCRILHPWRQLELAYSKKLLAAPAPGSGPLDTQAMAFLRFTEGEAEFPRVWVWSLARNFCEVFPASGHKSDAEAVITRLNAALRDEGKQVVVHGHIPVIEPISAPVRPPQGTVATGSGALYIQIAQQPSNWSVHRLLVDNARRKRLRMEHYPVFDQHVKLYPGNEWPYVANAAYQFRVKGRAMLAVEFANKALVLNPGNAKAHAIRGMIRVVSGDSLDAGLVDLIHAFELDPASLGDEPETLQAAVFLVEKTVASGQRTTAQAYLQSLGEVRAFNAQQPLKAADEFRALLQRADAP